MRASTPGESSWIDLAGAQDALQNGTGAKVRIAVLDSGVETNHPALAGCEFADDLAVAEEGDRLIVHEGMGEDLYGHGTAVAAIIHEVAPEAVIGNFRVLDARNRSRSEIICEGVRRAIDRGYHILNCSFGCRGAARFVLPFKEWTDEAYLKGIHVVAACGSKDTRHTEWPSHFSSVIAVNLARGAEGNDIVYHENTLVEFAARGEKIRVAALGGTTRVDTGSSYAAPRITGLIARLLSVAPQLHPDLVHEILRRLARPASPTKTPD